MALEFNLPEIGEGVVEGEIVEWHVKAGDQVGEDRELVAVLTDKATVEITSTFSGVIDSTIGEPGDMIAVGSLLLTYNADGEAAPVEEPKAPANTGQATVKSPGGNNVVDFPLPEIGEGVMEGEVVEWHVAIGDTVTHDMPILAILTDKATVEITAPFDGVMVEMSGNPGDMLSVGDVIAKIRASDAADAPAAVAVPVEAAPKAAPSKAASAPARALTPADNPSISAFGTPLATPAVRKLAAAKGIDLHTVVGTGPNHRITRDDVEKASTAPAPVPVRATSPAPAPVTTRPAATPAVLPVGDRERREKLKGLRKAIHASMARSKRIVPHFTYVDEVEMDKLVAMRSELKDVASAEGVKLTYLPFIAKAIVLALQKFPILNSSVDDNSGEIVYKSYYNLGVATATQDGLMVPVVKDADQKSVLQIAREIAEVSEAARNRKAGMDDLTGGTFTITSLGRLGGLFATPIINYPEVGILGIHNLQERAVVRDGQITIRKMMNISLSCDHRVVDGDVGAAFAQEVKTYLEEPGRLMLHMS